MLLAEVIVAGLGALGGALGGVLIALTIVTHQMLDPIARCEIARSDIEFITAVTVMIGTTCGVFRGPLVAWMLLRRAPLWRAIGETAIAAAIGVGLGSRIPWGGALLVLPL